ncbi:MAG: universal stress protein [Hyphomicrobiaceae bacterium]
MAFKRILLPINGQDDIDLVADYAFKLAAMNSAEVEVLHPYPRFYDVITSVSESGSANQIAQEIQSVRDRYQDENRKAAEHFARLSSKYTGTTTRFVEREGHTSEILTRRAFSSDLTVVGSAERYDSAFWRNVYDGALVHSARPVFVVPTRAGSPPATDQLAQNVLIAWKGSTELVRALEGAKPFLASAVNVRLIAVGERDRIDRTVEQMKDYLSLHSSDVTAKAVEAVDGHIAKTILAEAKQMEHCLLVMGAYSHARWRERFFGGVTEYVLHNGDVPILMAH